MDFHNDLFLYLQVRLAGCRRPPFPVLMPLTAISTLSNVLDSAPLFSFLGWVGTALTGDLMTRIMTRARSLSASGPYLFSFTPCVTHFRALCYPGSPEEQNRSVEDIPRSKRRLGSAWEQFSGWETEAVAPFLGTREQSPGSPVVRAASSAAGQRLPSSHVLAPRRASVPGVRARSYKRSVQTSKSSKPVTECCSDPETPRCPLWCHLGPHLQTPRHCGRALGGRRGDKGSF